MMQMKLNVFGLNLGFHNLVMYFDDGLLNLTNSVLFPRFFFASRVAQRGPRCFCTRKRQPWCCTTLPAGQRCW